MNMMSETAIGIILALIGALINNFGVVLQKRQVNLKAPPKELEKSMKDIYQFLKDPLWVLGILMQTIFYLPFLIIAYDLIKITLLQPISSAGIIFLVLGLVWLVNEKLRGRFEYLGLGILIFGVIIISFGGVVGETTLYGFLSSASSFWIIFAVILASSLLFLIPILKIKKTQLIFLGFLIGNCYAFVSISMQIFTLALMDLNHPLGGWLLAAGILGAIVGTVFGVLAAQEAFKRGQAIYVIPFTQISMNLIPILTGLLVFEQIIMAPFFFWIGVISIVVGASFLARFQ